MRPQGTIKSLALSLFCTLSLLLSSNAFSKDKEIYIIGVGTDSNDFENNAAISASGNEITGSAIIYINDNPVMGYNSGGTIKQINQYIKNGENSIQIRGKSDKSLFVKIGILLGKEVKNVVIKKEFTPNDILKNTTLTFSVDVDYSLPIFNPKNNIPKEITAKSVYPLLKRLKSYLDNDDYEKAVDMLLGQRENWSVKAYGQDKNNFAAMKKEMSEFYRTNKLTYTPPELDKITIVKGKSIIFLYSGVDKNSYFKSKVLGKFALNGSKIIPAPAMKLAFIDNKWCIWE